MRASSPNSSGVKADPSRNFLIGMTLLYQQHMDGGQEAQHHSGALTRCRNHRWANINALRAGDCWGTRKSCAGRARRTCLSSWCAQNSKSPKRQTRPGISQAVLRLSTFAERPDDVASLNPAQRPRRRFQAAARPRPSGVTDPLSLAALQPARQSRKACSAFELSRHHFISAMHLANRRSSVGSSWSFGPLPTFTSH